MKQPVFNSSSIHNKHRSLITMKKILILTTAIAMITGAAFAYYLYHKPHQSVANETPAFTLDAASLVSEYDANEKKANSKYLGKIIEVKGVVSEKSKNSAGHFCVTLQGPDLAGIGCEFEPKAQTHAAKLKEGEEVCIKGICSGVLMDVVMVDCTVVPSE
jgi:tRNA_anti-like